MPDEPKIERSDDHDGREPAPADGTSALPVGWTYRGYLPHFDDQKTPQFITFRLADSIPANVIEAWTRELKLGVDRLSQPLDDNRQSKANRKLRERIEKYLDRGYGECLLKRHENADLVAKALQHFDGTRYQLFAWVIMPNHVHVLCRQEPDWPLSKIVQSWKSFTAHAINKSMARTGAIWQPDYFDRYIRNEAHLLAVAQYIETNPVSAGLCATAAEWRYSSIAESANVPSASCRSAEREKTDLKHSGRDVRAPEKL